MTSSLKYVPPDITSCSGKNSLLDFHDVRNMTFVACDFSKHLKEQKDLDLLKAV